MIQHDLIRIACRARLATLEVCTTGSATLAATTAGYTRTTGSFVTDGFAIGQEVAPTGFTQTAVGRITAVAALLLTIAGGRTAQASGAGRTLAVGMPSRVAYENVAFTPATDEPWFREQYLPGAASKRGLGARGFIEATPLYTVQVCVRPGVDATAIARYTDALLEHFASTTPLTLDNGDIATVRSDVAPGVSQLLHTEDGWAVQTVTIPLRLTTPNSR